MQPNQIPLEDPLSFMQAHPDAYRGAVLLSDQIEYYIRNLTPPLLSNPDCSPLTQSDLHDPNEGCLDAASYKLRLGNEANPESTEPSGGGAGKGPSRNGDGIDPADFGRAGPAAGLLPVRGAAHEVAGGSKELSLANSCGASGRYL